MNGPRTLSVVLVWRDPDERIIESLRSLIDPVQALDGEVIVVSGRFDRETESARTAISGARWIEIEAPVTEQRAWEAGFAVARCPIVAFAQARCRYEPGWAEAVLSAEIGPGRVAAGPVSPAPALGLRALASYLCDYGAFADPEGRGGGAVASNNLAFHRSDLARIADGRGLWKPRLMGSENLKPIWMTGMRAEVRPPESILAAALARYRRGRAFAAFRASRWPRIGAILAGCGCPILPILLMARLVADRYLRRHYPRAFGAGAPWIAGLLTAWSIGEMVGYWGGEGGTGGSL